MYAQNMTFCNRFEILIHLLARPALWLWPDAGYDSLLGSVSIKCPWQRWLVGIGFSGEKPHMGLVAGQAVHKQGKMIILRRDSKTELINRRYDQGGDTEQMHNDGDVSEPYIIIVMGQL